MSLVNLHPALARLDELAADPPTGKPSLIGYTREELTEFIKNAGEKSFRADQLYNALFARGLTSLQDVTTLSKSLRAELESHFTVDRPTIDQVEASADGTRKYRFVGVDGLAFEAVYIPEVATGSRTNTLCVSSQTGCAVGCKFCFTASIRRNRNLAAAEIVGQVLAVQEDVKELSEDARVTNIVLWAWASPFSITITYFAPAGSCSTQRAWTFQVGVSRSVPQESFLEFMTLDATCQPSSQSL